MNKQDILNNPVCAGMGPFSPIIDESEWFHVNVKSMFENGIENTIDNIIRMFEQVFVGLSSPARQTYIMVASHQPYVALGCMLEDFREAVENWEAPDDYKPPYGYDSISKESIAGGEIQWLWCEGCSRHFALENMVSWNRCKYCEKREAKDG